MAHEHPEESALTDAYIYYFMVRDGVTGEIALSQRRATLAAIKRIGEPVMESQIVADITEIDPDGFAIGDASDGSPPTGDVTSEIRSLQLRADSRDSKALTLNDTTDGEDKYMLQLESRELRSQARKLHNARGASTAVAACSASGTVDFAEFDDLLAIR
jgi:hypothetical protein